MDPSSASSGSDYATAENGVGHEEEGSSQTSYSPDFQEGTSGGTATENNSSNNGRVPGPRPSLKSIARDLKRAAEERAGYQEGSDDDEEGEGPDLGVKSSKISAPPSAAAKGGWPGSDEGQQRQQVSKSQQEVQKSLREFRRELFQILKEYFKAAFTIIIKKRRLCPSNGFQIVRVLGVKVPRFLHPSSLEYVEEVTQKLLLFLNRNATEGCAVHIMVEKSKTLHVVQRFVFKTLGAIDALSSVQDESGCCLEDLKTHCRASLLQIITSDMIKQISLPQFSRWSISIGLKKEFVYTDMEAFKQLWSADPSGGYFPWRERPKSLANKAISNNGGASRKEITASTAAKIESDDRDDHPLSVGSSNEKTPDPDSQEIPRNTPNTSVHRTTELESSNRSQTDNLTDTMSSGIVCFPVSSFAICEGLTLALYGVQYPTPTRHETSHHGHHHTPNSTNVSPFSSNKYSRPARSSMSYRLSQVRSRISKQSF